MKLLRALVLPNNANRSNDPRNKQKLAASAFRPQFFIKTVQYFSINRILSLGYKLISHVYIR